MFSRSDLSDSAQPVRSPNPLKRGSDVSDARRGPIRTNRTQIGRFSDAVRTPLPDRIRAMATRWNYSREELSQALELASQDPAAWLRVVEHDEALGVTAFDFKDRDPRPSQETEETQSLHSLEHQAMLTVSAETSTAFELPPAGPVAARCNRLIDLGSQESEYQGEKKMQRKLLLSWELAEARTDGTPFQISRRFGLSLHEKASLRQFLQAWRGRPFTDEELAGFDLRKLLNAPAMLNIGHTSRNGKDYANILSISPLPKGMSAPDLAVPPVAFDIDADNAPDVLETLSENLQATITASPEWQTRIKSAGDAFAGLDDDVVF